MHQQNKQVIEANKWVCDPLQQEPKKSFKHFPQYDVFISHILRLFSYWPKHFKDGKQKTSCKKNIFCSISDMNDSTSWCKSQFVWNQIFFWDL